MPNFFLKLIAPRPSFAMDMNDDEKQMMQERFGYWKAKLDRGEVVVFDPAGPYGAAVISASDEASARAFADDDPAMKSNRGFKCEIYPTRAVTRETVN